MNSNELTHQRLTEWIDSIRYELSGIKNKDSDYAVHLTALLNDLQIKRALLEDQDDSAQFLDNIDADNDHR